MEAQYTQETFLSTPNTYRKAYTGAGVEHRQIIKSRAWYRGVDPPEEPAVTCENCRKERRPVSLGPCPAGHVHVICFICWDSVKTIALERGGLAVLSWLN